MIENIMLAIVSIPENIYNLFKPDTEVIQQHIDDLEYRIKSVFNIQNFELGAVFGDADRPHVSGYKVNVFGVGKFNMPDIDFSWLELALEKFKPIIRGFLALMLIIYNTNQFLTFIKGSTIGNRFTPSPNADSKGGDTI